MQYIISPVTTKDAYSEYYTTEIRFNDTNLGAMANTSEESRLKAIKLAMLLAIQESENNCRLSALATDQHKL